MFESTSCIVRRIDVDTFDFSRILIFQCFKGKQIIPMDQHVFTVGISEQEVRFYMQKLQEMNYPNVSGYVWYIRRGDIVKINR